MNAKCMDEPPNNLFHNAKPRFALLGRLLAFSNFMNMSIITSFISDQRKAKKLVSRHLGMPTEINASDWALRYTDIQKKYDENPFADIFYQHGYGVEIKVGDFYIDYDYSISGRPDGFDAWKLFVYVTAGDFDCRGSDVVIRDKIHHWYNGLIECGKAKVLDNLCYLT